MAYKVIDIEGVGAAYAENLTAKMEEVNAEKKVVRRVPVVAEVQKMVDFAKELPGVLTY